MEKHQLSIEGYYAQKARLKKLVEVDQPANIEALKDARAQGDLSENAEYDVAREEQARIAAEIKETQDIIKNAEILVTEEEYEDVKKSLQNAENANDKDKVSEIKEILEKVKVVSKNNIGKKITVKYLDDNEEDSFLLVGSSLESDPANGKISKESPLGKAVLNANKGEEVKVKPDSGIDFIVKIIDIK